MKQMTIGALAAAGLMAGLAMQPAQAVSVVYTAPLLGASESPPVVTPATGTATITMDLSLLTMRVQTSFAGLLGTVTAAHIHCCTALPGTGNVGVATQLPTFSGFPSGVTSGFYDNTFDMTQLSSYNPTYVTNNGGTALTAFSALLAGFNAGTAYVNIHTTQFPGGEIRALIPAVPEPETWGLMALGLAVLGVLVRPARRAAATA